MSRPAARHELDPRKVQVGGLPIDGLMSPFWKTLCAPVQKPPRSRERERV